MDAYYNENNPFAAQWLRNLIDAGHIAPGYVDERDIRDVRASDLDGFTQCHFFAGIGVWSHALRQAGWPDDRSVWTGSCPCQPFSGAGKRKGVEDERHLWPVWFDLIRECRPGVILGEQVASKDGLGWWDIVSGDLEGTDYASAALDLCVPGVGGPHIRQRLYWMAHANHEGSQGRRERRHGSRERVAWPGGVAGGVEHAESNGKWQSRVAKASEEQQKPVRGSSVSGVGAGSLNGFWRDADWLFCTDGKWRPTQSGIQPLAHGVAGRVGRLRAYGNAICAPQAQEFVEAVMDVLTEGKRTMNAIVHKRFESLAAMASYAHVLARAADAIPVGSGGLPILKMDEKGYFNFGEDATEVSDDDLWAINPFHVLRGYICFSSKNEVLGEVLRPITAEPVDLDKLPIHTERDKRGREVEIEWKAQIVLHMQCIAGPNEGASVVYKPTSGGGLKLCRTILHEIARRLAKGTDKPVPTGYLTAEGYKHKGFNKKIFNPLFEFDKWVDMEFADADAGPIEDEAPAEEEHKSATRSRSRDAEDAEVIEDEPKRGRGTRDRDNNPKDYDGRREDDEPRGRSRRANDNDAEEAPKRGRGRPKKEATNDDDEPRGRRAARRDDEVDDQDEDGNPRRTRATEGRRDSRQDAEEGTRKRGEPAPRRGRGRDEDDDAPRGRERGGRGRDRDDDDDAPRSRSRR